MTKAFSAYSTNSQIVKESSSGGIFTLFAIEIISKGGVVFGAAFDDNWNVHHIQIDNKEDIGKIRGSKYVQSDLGNTFIKIKKIIKSGQIVLFCGTPCQVDGLLLFLTNVPKDNLYTIDIVCHGVPSPKIWQKYIYEKKDILRKISFRNKRYGWKTYSLRFDYNNGTYKSKIFTHDRYMQAFINNLTLRPSCYNCKSKGIVRKSDITLADFWGIEKISGGVNNINGVSLLLVHSKKGDEFLHGISDNAIDMKEVPIDIVPTLNPSAVFVAKKPLKRDALFKNIDNYSFDELYKKYIKKNFICEFKLYIKGIIKIILYYFMRIKK